MKPLLFGITAALALHGAGAVAQTPRQASFDGAQWAYFQYETGAANRTILTGQPSLHLGQPHVVITVVSRNGQRISDATRGHAAQFARALCRRAGGDFNRASQGRFIDAGLSFQGDCDRW